MRTSKTITLFLIFFLIPVSLFAQSKDDLKEAVSHYNEGNYSEAIKLFDPYLEKTPAPKVYYLKGYALYKMSRFDEARDSFRHSYPGDLIKPSSLIAQSKDDLRKDDLRKDDLRKDDLRKAIFYYNKGDYSEAVELFDLYLEKNPDPNAYYIKGYALYKMSRFDEARDSFKQAYLLDPEVTMSKAIDMSLGIKARKRKDGI